MDSPPTYIPSDHVYMSYLLDLTTLSLCAKNKKGLYVEIDSDTTFTPTLLSSSYEIIEDKIYIKSSDQNYQLFFSFTFETVKECMETEVLLLRKKVKVLEDALSDQKDILELLVFNEQIKDKYSYYCNACPNGINISTKFEKCSLLIEKGNDYISLELKLMLTPDIKEIIPYITEFIDTLNVKIETITFMYTDYKANTPDKVQKVLDILKECDLKYLKKINIGSDYYRPGYFHSRDGPTSFIPTLDCKQRPEETVYYLLDLFKHYNELEILTFSSVNESGHRRAQLVTRSTSLNQVIHEANKRENSIKY